MNGNRKEYRNRKGISIKRLLIWYCDICTHISRNDVALLKLCNITAQNLCTYRSTNFITYRCSLNDGSILDTITLSRWILDHIQWQTHPKVYGMTVSWQITYPRIQAVTFKQRLVSYWFQFHVEYELLQFHSQIYIQAIYDIMFIPSWYDHISQDLKDTQSHNFNTVWHILFICFYATLCNLSPSLEIQCTFRFHRSLFLR